MSFNFHYAEAKQLPAILELTETEEKFIDTLKIIQDPFLKNLKPYFNPEDHEFISVLQAILDAHSSFYEKLIRCKSVVAILELFTSWYDQMLVHSLYIYRLPFVQDKIDHLCQCNKPLDEQIKKDLQEFKYLSLTNDLLIRPSQRFLKYKLLIEKLIESPVSTGHKGTTPTPCHIMGQKAIEVIEDVSRYLDEVRRSYDDWKKVKDATNRISNWKDKNSLESENLGILMHEGELNVLCSGNEAPKLHYVFLFSRKLIACDIVKTPDKQPKKSFLYCWDLDLDQYNLKDNEVSKTTFVMKSRKILPATCDGNQDAVCGVRPITTLEVVEIRAKINALKIWLPKFRQAIDLLQPVEARNNSHQFDIISSQLPTKTKCGYCQKLLRGFYPHGYSCKACHVVLHKECLVLDRICPADENSSQSLDHYPWYAGIMSREDSEFALKDAQTGTFLLRYKLESFVDHKTNRYAISVKCTASVKHIRIHQERLLIQREQYVYFLREDKKFDSIKQLVDFFSQQKLKEYFSDSLNVELSIPWRRVVHTAVALYDSISTKVTETDDTAFKTISFVKGQCIIILGKEYDAHGWWRGFSDGKEGYFPKNYVK